MELMEKRVIVEDIVRLRRRIEASQIPLKITDYNLLIGTWNIRSFGRIHEAWQEDADTPKRTLRSLVYLSEIIRRFDVVAIQEVKQDMSGIKLLMDKFLGRNWGLIFSDVTAGSSGNAERLAFIFDKRRVQPSGLAGEIVLPPTPEGNPVQQFDRTPYIVGFRCGGEKFVLLTAHIKYGDSPAERIPEIRALSKYIAEEIRKRANAGEEEKNLIVLGDFNIDDRGDNPLFQAFVETGLVVPPQLLNQKTTYNTKAKFYDQIAWFMDDLDLNSKDKAGVIDFTGAVYKELTPADTSYRVSDHYPLWVEFITDRSTEQMSRVLGVDAGMPEPFDVVPD